MVFLHNKSSSVKRSQISNSKKVHGDHLYNYSKSTHKTKHSPGANAKRAKDSPDEAMEVTRARRLEKY